MTEFYPVTIVFDVNWGDMDAFGHVNNARYFTWFESCRTAYFVRLGLRMDHPSSLGPIVARLSCDYIAPVSYPANLTCGVSVVKIGNTSFTMAYGLWATGKPEQLHARGESVVVLLDYDTNQKVRVPDYIRRAIDELENSSPRQTEPPSKRD
jgi:acyl-CoA thioester hydrolase